MCAYMHLYIYPQEVTNAVWTFIPGYLKSRQMPRSGGAWTARVPCHGVRKSCWLSLAQRKLPTFSIRFCCGPCVMDFAFHIPISNSMPGSTSCCHCSLRAVLCHKVAGQLVRFRTPHWSATNHAALDVRIDVSRQYFAVDQALAFDSRAPLGAAI